MEKSPAFLVQRDEKNRSAQSVMWLPNQYGCVRSRRWNRLGCQDTKDWTYLLLTTSTDNGLHMFRAIWSRLDHPIRSVFSISSLITRPLCSTIGLGLSSLSQVVFTYTNVEFVLDPFGFKMPRDGNRAKWKRQRVKRILETNAELDSLTPITSLLFPSTSHLLVWA